MDTMSPHHERQNNHCDHPVPNGHEHKDSNETSIKIAMKLLIRSQATAIRSEKIALHSKAYLFFYDLYEITGCLYATELWAHHMMLSFLPTRLVTVLLIKNTFIIYLC